MSLILEKYFIVLEYFPASLNYSTVVNMFITEQFITLNIQESRSNKVIE